MVKFDDIKLSEDLKEAIKRLGFDTPTLIQHRAIPPILKGKDVIGKSATGSGKTLAFGCGVIEHVEPGKGLQALILTPTRELAEQVKDAVNELVYKRKLNIISIYGGVAINPQIDALKTAEVVIATPGRFKDHLQRRTVNPTKIRLLILDEADRMLDMGFIEDIEDIIKTTPKSRQTLFFSATIPPAIDKLSKKYLKDPIKIFGKGEVDPSKLRQYYYDIPPGLKISLLVHLLKEDNKMAMVFCNTRKNTDMIISNLKANGIKAVALHGGFTQNKRNKSLEDFKNGRINVLVCTDVASRGIDIDNISHIYNYESPKDPTDYTHRIGRTARAGEEGKVINLIADYDHDSFRKILSNKSEYSVKKLKTPYVKKIAVKKAEPHQRRRFPRRSGNRR